ncbi:MAG: hypothetical protein ACE366_23375 [Bradymonadia bacterium]
MIRSLLCHAVCLTLSACMPVGCEDNADVAVPSLTETEKQTLVSRLEHAAEDNRQRQCPRPVLHGTATIGDGEVALLELIDDEGPHARCYTEVERIGRILPDLYLGLDPKQLEVRATPQARETALTACALIPEKVSSLAAHEAMCSPSLFGRRASKSLMNSQPLALATALHSLDMATRDPMAALRLAFDGMRLQHDLERGGRNIFTATISALSISRLGAAATIILDDPRLTVRQLEEVIEMLDILIGTQPPVGGMLSYDMLESAYRGALLDVMPPGWTHPEGPLPDRRDRLMLTDDEREQIWLSLMSFDETVELRDEMCPQGAGVLTCLSGLQERDRRYEALVERRDTAAGEGEAAMPLMMRKMRREQLRILHGVAQPDPGQLLRRLAMREATLRALKAQAEAHRVAGGFGRCPETVGVELLEGVGLVKDAGVFLEAERRGDDGWWLYLPGYLVGKASADSKEAAGSIKCSSGLPSAEGDVGDGAQSP